MIAVHIVNDAHIPAREVRAVQRALEIQVNTDLRRWWHVGRVAFRRQGLRVLVVRRDLLGGGLPPGWHGIDGRGRPFAYVLYQTGWTTTMSHELLEMLLNPYGRNTSAGYQREICDPVQSATYTVAGVTVSDFVTPAWFRPGSSGPWDALRLLSGPGQMTAQGFSTMASNK